jgi:hypothetical protein
MLNPLTWQQERLWRPMVVCGVVPVAASIGACVKSFLSNSGQDRQCSFNRENSRFACIGELAWPAHASSQLCDATRTWMSLGRIRKLGAALDANQWHSLACPWK